MPTLTQPPHVLADGDSPHGSPPPPPSPFEAVRRHPFLTLLPILLLVGAAIAVGLDRKPTFEAHARLSVGELNPSVQSAPGIVEANQQLASAYSRAVNAQAVLEPVERKLDLPPGAARGRLSASPVPESPIMNIKGTGDSEREAVAITSAASDALIGYIRSLSGRDEGAERTLKRLEDARVVEERANDAVDGAETPRNNARLASAELRVKALQQAYLDEASGGGATPVQVINRAESATSDRDEQLKLMVAIAALAGLALGVALATARAGRLHRKRAY